MTSEQTVTIQQAIDLALQHHNEGDLPKAESIYQQILRANPNQPTALHYLGVIAHQVGKNDISIGLIKNAISIKPDYAEAYSNLGNALQQLGQFDEAVAALNKALAIKPNYGQARFNLGVLLYENSQYKEAAEQFKLTNFEKSKSFLLKSLYELDAKSLFYDQLDDLISQGEINPVIGSLCSRSHIRYGSKRPNPFCNDPLKYILKTDLIEQCDFSNVFVETAKKILNDDTVSHKSQELLANGYQTAGNLLLLKIDLMEELKRILDSEIEKYRLFFKDSEEGFIRHWPTSYSLKSWLISMTSGGELRPHMHENGWISGSVYINVPFKSKPDSGNLVVCIDEEEYSTSANKNLKKSIDVVTGSLCLFPASLIHYTIPFESKEERIVLAFDVIPK